METLNRLPWMAKSAVFRRLAEVAEVSALSKEERIKYDHALKVYRDSINAERYAEYKAEKAMQEGMEKGMDTANRENARKMKADNMPIELIVKYTGLTSEEINSL